ncbi:MAG: alpha/beta fold hydrolase BchO [Granulosicoccus sp.]
MSTYSPASRMVQSGALQWNVRTVGSGPICLLIHGTGASVHTWDNLAPLLAQHYTVVMMDLPGHADTLTPANADLTLPGMATALFQLIKQENLQADTIVGHSAGAAVMLEMCLQHPQCAKRLISINAAVMPLVGLAGYLFSPLARMSANSQWMPRFFSYRARNDKNIRKLLDSTGSVVDPQSFRRYAELFSNPSHVSGVLRMMANWHLEKLTPRLGQLQQPILLIASSEDKTIPLRDTYKLQKLIPGDNVRTSVITGRGHLLHEEDPTPVAQLILDSATHEDK